MPLDDHATLRPAIFRDLLLEMGQERSLENLLALVVSRLHDIPPVALARIWLLAPGDICGECHLENECRDRTSCLHLVASAGSSRVDDTDWSGLNGTFRRIPMGVRKVGHIAATAETVEIRDLESDSKWIAKPDWAEKEGIHGFCGEPLIYRGETMGVIGLFTREEHPELDWLRVVADHAASAIANARAFEEIESLRSQLELENEYLRDEVRTAQGFGEIVGRSADLMKVLDQVGLVAPTVTSVLILGETGTGKELIARAIHEHSRRSEGPLIRVNCASIPSELFESEFFGHLKGAFTGAVRDRIGRFELADGGTLFLDEVAEIPLEMQGKLLRVLQEQSFERVGEERSRSADTRIVAATNRNLETEVGAGHFRQDLYYRLSVFPIELPPLRQRREDISLLARHFLSLHARILGVQEQGLRQGDLNELERYPWPGNIRELSNVIERALITAGSGRLNFDLPEADTKDRAERQKESLLTDSEVRRRERDNLLAVLEHTGWKIAGGGGAAEYLGLHPATLTSRMKTMGIARRPGSGAS